MLRYYDFLSCVLYCMYMTVHVLIFDSVCTVVLATIFNCLQSPPDVIQETTSIATSPTATLTSVGFRYRAIAFIITITYMYSTCYPICVCTCILCMSVCVYTVYWFNCCVIAVAGLLIA